MYVNLREIYENYPDDYDRICELLCESMSPDPKIRAQAKLVLKKYGL